HAAANAITVGAVNWQSPTTPEPFTSQGMVPILFDANGKRLESVVQRWKPDLVGPDGVSTLTFPVPSTPLPPGQFPVFSGAAAARHAGSAALQRAQAPTYDSWAVVLNMEHKATTIAPSGWDKVTGFGLDPVGGSGPAIQLNGNSWTLIGPAPSAPGQVPGGG